MGELQTKRKTSPTAESLLRSLEESTFSLQERTNITGAPSPFPTQEKEGSKIDITNDQFREIYSMPEEPQLFKEESFINRLNILEDKEDVIYHKTPPKLKSVTGKISAEPQTDKTGMKRTNVASHYHEAKRSKLDSRSTIGSSDSSVASKSEIQSASLASTPNNSTTDSTIGKESETGKSVQKDRNLPSKLRMLIELNKMKRQKTERTPKETLQKMVHRVEREVNRRLAFASANISEDYELASLLGLNPRGVSRAPNLDSIASVSQELIELFKSSSKQKEDKPEETTTIDKNKQNKPSPDKRKGRPDANKESIASVEIPLEYGFVDPRTTTDHGKTNQEKVVTSKTRRNATQEVGSPPLTENKQRTTKAGSQNTETDKRVMLKQSAQPKTHLVDKYVQEKQKPKNTNQVTKPGKQKDVAFAEIMLQKEKAREVTPGLPVDIWDN